ncbi:MAG: hypothetical protein O3B37_01530 [Proteobacteria bacterium]|nr:hypothetical protein [Pseudomonadota bacterium]
MAALPAAADDNCGMRVSVDIRDGQTQAYSFGVAADETTALATLVLLPGGGGAVNLDAQGCPRDLTGNTLTRNVSAFRAAGFTTALVDAPTDHQSGDGLGGFRTDSAHADDLGAVIADIRGRSALPVYIVGSSRGTISAVNAAANLTGIYAPDGVILFSPITSGRVGGQKAWVAQTVFDASLGNIHQPILVVAHESDACIRTPPEKARDILPRTNGAIEQMVMVTGGPATDTGVTGVKACQGKFPHGFGGQDDLVNKLISEFVANAAAR